MNIEQFKTLRAPLVKAFGDDINKDEVIIRELIRHNFYETIIYEAGATSVRDAYFWTAEEIGELFGLPYTSSGDFAGLWVTNTQAVSRYGDLKLTFRCGAKDETGAHLLIFEDSEEQFYYFYDYDFAKWQAYEKKKNKAKEYSEFVKNANKTAKKVFEILKKYNGKAYGEKTRQKIHEEINQEAHRVGLVAYLESVGGVCSNIEIHRIGHYSPTLTYYTDIVNSENKIEVSEAPKMKEEVDGVKTFEKLAKKREAISKKAKELQELIEEAHKLERAINDTAKASESIYSVNLDYLARGYFEK